MKWNTMKCNNTLANTYSAKPRSGLCSSAVSANTLSASALAPATYCILKLTVNTNCPTHEMNPPKNALKGKLPTNNTYTNCKTPNATKNTKNESINFNRGVKVLW